MLSSLHTVGENRDVPVVMKNKHICRLCCQPPEVAEYAGVWSLQSGLTGLTMWQSHCASLFISKVEIIIVHPSWAFDKDDALSMESLVHSKHWIMGCYVPVNYQAPSEGTSIIWRAERVMGHCPQNWDHRNR